MIMNGVYASERSLAAVCESVKPDSSQDNAYEVGQVIEGIISKVSDQITIDFSGRELNFSQTAVTNAKEGEIRKFQVMDVSKTGIVLKEVGSTGNNGEQTANRSMIFTQVGSNSLNTFAKENSSTDAKDDSDLEEVSSRMTKEDYEELTKDGVSLESYSLERLERALARIKEQRSVKSEQIENQSERIKQETENIKKMAVSTAIDSGFYHHIAAQLVNADLPITQENVERIAKAINQAQAVNQLSDSSAYYLIKNEMEPTIENIYKAVHSGTKNQQTSKETAFNEIKETVEQVVKDFDDTEKAFSQAKWLFESNLPVTKETISYKLSLDELISEQKLQQEMPKMADAIREGKSPDQALVIDEKESAYHQVMNSLQGIDEHTVSKSLEKLYSENKDTSELTIAYLQSVQLEMNSAPESDEVHQVNKTEAMNAALITAKRQLEEIRCKLTFEASQKLAAKGFHIETDSISKVVDGLKEMEQDYYKNLMQEVGGQGEESLSLLKATSEAVGQLKQSSSAVLAATFSVRHTVSIGQLSQEAIHTDAKFAQAEKSYEALMTAPRKDMGDSIQKAFAHVDDYLTELGLEPTKANQRAIRILGYNNIELTVENVMSMKAYDAKVNDLLTNLTPAVTAELIKDGVNPLNQPIDEVNAKAEELKKADPISDKRKYSEFLVELESKNSITKDERDSYIGIYRLLHQVKESDGAAIGALVKSKKELTLNNLLTEVRVGKHTPMDYQVDDEFGVNSGAAGYHNSILAQAETAFMEQKEYGNHLVASVTDALNADTVTVLQEQFKDKLYDTTIESMAESIENKESAVKEQLAKEKLDSYMELAKTGRESIQFLQDYGIIDSIQNIVITKEMMEHNDGLYERMRQAIPPKNNPLDKESLKQKSMIDAISDKDTLNEALDSIEEEVKNSINDGFNQDSLLAAGAKELIAVSDILGLCREFRRKEHYNIPVMMEDKVTNINLTIIHNSEDKGKVRITLPTSKLGTIHAEFSANGKELNGLVTTDHREGLDTLAGNQEMLLKAFDENGLSVKQLNYCMESRTNSSFIYTNGNIYKESEAEYQAQKESKETSDVDSLYLAAKVLIEKVSILVQ